MVGCIYEWSTRGVLGEVADETGRPTATRAGGMGGKRSQYTQPRLRTWADCFSVKSVNKSSINLRRRRTGIPESAHGPKINVVRPGVW